ncbi:Hvo_1808 family surface protein [Halobium salinum]|uniref:Hvo_1808 family surface protein n=1 Tax=Halobium salinum TaxID=1364940 RepID=A0ABD5PBT4_9EURY|nr:Hvo_1808 family surface protein [Halobium salinum]
MRQATALWLVLLVVAAGVAPGVGAAAAAPATGVVGETTAEPAEIRETGAPLATEPDGPSSTPSASQSASQSDAPDDPDEDVIGWEEGYWHNESIDVDQSDGLSDEELDAYVSRAMARVEYVREREFKEDVPVSVISREEYREQAGNQAAANASYTAWNNQVWEALFLVGEETNVQTELGSTLGASVAGFYAPGDDEIKIITPDPDSPTVDNATLVHELTHAMQDQYHDLSQRKYRGTTQDGSLAADGVVEGEANYVEDKYRMRCASGEWDCVETPAAGGGGSGSGPQPNLGVLVTLLQPYSDGPAYVHSLYERGGWDAVERKMANPPNATEQTIHVTDEAPTPIEFEDNATDGWELYPNLGENGSDTVGEASLYAMAYYQDRQNGLPGVDYRNIANAPGEYDTYNYTTRATKGWANDRVFPYHAGSGNDTQYGYVWVTEWDTTRDAREFQAFYRDVLDAQGAEQQADGSWVVEEGRFADSFLVRQNGTRVTIVNGPDAEAVEAIRPGLAASVEASQERNATTTSETTTDETTTATTTAPVTTTATAANDSDGTTVEGEPVADEGTTGTDSTVPGFGPVVALAALAALVAGAVRFGRSGRSR